MDKRGLSAEQRAALSYLVLIQNDKGSYMMAEKWNADELVFESRAIIIEKTDPDYVKAWGLAHGRSKGFKPGELIQVAGEVRRADFHNSDELDKEWERLNGKPSATAKEEVEKIDNGGFVLPTIEEMSVKTGAVAVKRGRGRPSNAELAARQEAVSGE